MWHDKGRVGEGSGSFLVLGHIRIPANQATRLKTKSTLETYLFCQDCGLRTYAIIPRNHERTVVNLENSLVFCARFIFKAYIPVSEIH